MLEFSGLPGFRSVHTRENQTVLHGQGVEFAGFTGSQPPHHMSEIQQVLHGLQQVLKQHNGNASSTGF